MGEANTSNEIINDAYLVGMGLWMIEKGAASDESMRRAATTLRGLLERLA